MYNEDIVNSLSVNVKNFRVVLNPGSFYFIAFPAFCKLERIPNFVFCSNLQTLLPNVFHLIQIHQYRSLPDVF